MQCRKCSRRKKIFTILRTGTLVDLEAYLKELSKDDQKVLDMLQKRNARGMPPLFYAVVYVESEAIALLRSHAKRVHFNEINSERDAYGRTTLGCIIEIAQADGVHIKMNCQNKTSQPSFTLSLSDLS